MTIYFRLLAAILCFLYLSACEQPDGADKALETPETAIPHAQLGDNVIPREYRIDLRINPDDDTYSGIVEIDVSIKAPTSKIWLHGKEMTVDRAVAVSGGDETELNYHAVPVADAPSGLAYLTSEEPLPTGNMTLRLNYSTPFNRALYSAYKVERDGEAYIVTQFEPIGAREAFPSFDEPRFKVPFTVSITAPADDFVYANTPEISVETLSDGWLKHNFAKTRPLPTYLIAYGVGPFDVVEYADLPPTEVRDRPIALRGIAAKGYGDKFTYGLENTAGIMEAIEGYFGIPYPYEKLDLIAAPEYAFGAMENPGAIVYREYLMLLDENAPLSQKRSYAGVHSHELAHQWFGNLVTPYWWEDIWLNEAFATWMGNKGTSTWKPEGNFDRRTLNAALGAMSIDTLATTRKIREPLLRSENVMDQFDSITYRKGGGVLSMFESYLGEDRFRDGVRLHMSRFADGVATADDFFQSIADGSKDPEVVSALKSFVDQPGLPLIEADMTCEAGKTEIALTQSRYAPLGSKTKQGQTWEIPVCIASGNTESGRTKTCTLMREKTATLIPEGNNCADWVTLNENGSGYYRFNLSDGGWNDLLTNLDSLNTRELLTVWDSLDAAFNAGVVSADVYIKGMEAFAASSEYDVAQNAGKMLAWFDFELPQDAKPDIARLTQDMYGERYKRIAGLNTVEGNLLAPTLAGRLTNYGQDEALASEFAAKGADYLGLEGPANKSAVPQNMLNRALREIFRARGETVLEPLLDLVTAGSSFEKSAALSALSSVKSAELAARLRDIAISDDNDVTGRQASSILVGQLFSAEHDDAAWNWFKANFSQFVENKVPDVRKGVVPAWTRNFCSLEKRDDVNQFFLDNKALIPGYERSLAQTLEKIELCAALKAAKAEELRAALKAR